MDNNLNIRIIHVVYRSSPSIVTSNGVAFVLYHILREMVKKKYDVELLEIGKRNQVKESKNLPVFNIHWFNLILLVKYLLKLEKEKSILIFHSVHIIPFIILGWLLEILKLPYIIVPHGGLSTKELAQKSTKKKIFKILFQKHWLNKASSVQALTPDEKNDIIQYGAKCEIFCVPNGLTLKKPQNYIENFWEKYLPDTFGKIKIVFIGRIDVFHKGLDILLDGFSQLKSDDLQKCILLVVGPDVDNGLSKLQLQARQLKIDSHVRFINALFGEEKYSALLDADLFVQTSRYEGFSMMVLEVLNCGIPLLVSKCASLNGKIQTENAGFVVEEDPHSIAEAISQFLKLKQVERNIFKENSLKLSENYRIENIVEELILEYKKCLLRKFYRHDT